MKWVERGDETLLIWQFRFGEVNLVPIWKKTDVDEKCNTHKMPPLTIHPFTFSLHLAALVLHKLADQLLTCWPEQHAQDTNSGHRTTKKNYIKKHIWERKFVVNTGAWVKPALFTLISAPSTGCSFTPVLKYFIPQTLLDLGKGKLESSKVKYPVAINNTVLSTDSSGCPHTDSLMQLEVVLSANMGYLKGAGSGEQDYCQSLYSSGGKWWGLIDSFLNQ